MFKKMKDFKTAAAVVMAGGIIVYTVFVLIGERKNDILFDNVDAKMLNIDIDTNYVQLPDIDSDKVVEHTISESQIIANDIIFDKSQGYIKVSEQNPEVILLTDEKGYYIAVGKIEQEGGYSDISIIKYDIDGNELKKQIYGGSDFDWVNFAKYSSHIGIVISGISQSDDGDFGNDNNSPFVACVDSETLTVKWISFVQSADDVYYVSDEAVYVYATKEKNITEIMN